MGFRVKHRDKYNTAKYWVSDINAGINTSTSIE